MRAETVLIRTPEGIEFNLPLAGPFSRMLAFAVDLAAIAAAGAVPGALGGSSPALQRGCSPKRDHGLIFRGFTALRNPERSGFGEGQTLGKRLLGLRVVEASGLRLRPSQIIVRNLLRFVDLLPGLYLVGGISCVLSSRRQRLGDIAAGTIVIRTPQLKEPDVDQVLGRKFNSLAEYRHLAARLRQKVPAKVAHLALEAILRRDEIQPAARLVLFREFGEYLKNVVPYPAEIVEQLTDEQYVRNTVDVLFQRKSLASQETKKLLPLGSS